MIVILATNAIARTLMKSACSLWAIQREQKIAAKRPVQSSWLLSLFGLAGSKATSSYRTVLQRQEREALNNVRAGLRRLILSLSAGGATHTPRTGGAVRSIRANLYPACCPA